MNNFSEVANEIYNSNSRFRWRKEELNILEGEARAILGKSGIQCFPSNVKAVASAMKLWATYPESFSNKDAESRKYQSNIGRLLYQRNNEPASASKYFKIWRMSDANRFATYDLPSLLRFKNGQVELSRVIEVFADWDKNKSEILSVVSTEFYNNPNRKNTDV